MSELPLLNESERSCLERYLDLLCKELEPSLVEVSVYGSVARGESWPQGIPIRSDLDLLVVTESPVPEDVVAQLVDATFPLFLESGRVIGPVFRTEEELAHPKTERAAEFVAQARRDAITVYRRT